MPLQRRIANQPPGMGRQSITTQGTSGPQSSRIAPEVQYVEDFFIYGLNFLALAAAATAIGSIQIDADSDFKLVKLALQADVAAAAQTISNRTNPLATMTIVDTGAGRNLFSIPIALGALFGSGELPFILPVPRIFKARTQVSITLVSYEAANTNNIRLAFIGNKVFAQGINI